VQLDLCGGATQQPRPLSVIEKIHQLLRIGQIGFVIVAFDELGVFWLDTNSA
jgi:hypothetical protein